MDKEFKELIQDLIKSNKEVCEVQKEEIKQLKEQVKAMHLSRQQEQKHSVPVQTNGALEQCKALEALANMIETFVYEEENGLTFENWYNRFRGIISVGAAQMDDKAKVEVVLMKLETSANALYRKSIAPKKPDEYSFDDTIKRLTTMFKKKTSLLRTRWNCLHIERQSNEDIAAYGARVNQDTEDFCLKDLTSEQFKVLVFIMGMRDNRDKSIRTRLLNLQDKTKAEEVKLQTMIEEAERILEIERDSNTLGITSESVYLVHSSGSRTKNDRFDKSSKDSPTSKDNSTTPSPTSGPKIPRTPCWKCGALHYVKECNFINHICTRCNVKGHKEGYCDALGNKHDTNSSKKAVHILTNSSTSSAVPDHHTALSSAVHRTGNNSRKFVDLFVNKHLVNFQFDTGSDITLLSEDTWRNIAAPPLAPASCRLLDYQENPLPLIGEVTVEVAFNNKTIVTRCFVTKWNKNIFGIDWINEFNLWEQPISAICNQDSSRGQRPDPVSVHAIISMHVPSSTSVFLHAIDTQDSGHADMLSRLCADQPHDDDLQQTKKSIAEGWPPKTTIISRDVFKFFREKFQIIHHVLFCRDHTVAPPSYRSWHGSMETLVTENGPQWTSARLEEYCSSHAIDDIRTTSFMPMCNVLAERSVDTVKRALSESRKSNVGVIQESLILHRAPPIAQALYAPQLIHRRPMRSPTAINAPPCSPALPKDIKMEQQFNKKHGVVPCSFAEGERVHTMRVTKAQTVMEGSLTRSECLTQCSKISKEESHEHTQQLHRHTLDKLPSNILFDQPIFTATSAPPFPPSLPLADSPGNGGHQLGRRRSRS